MGAGANLRIWTLLRRVVELWWRTNDNGIVVCAKALSVSRAEARPRPTAGRQRSILTFAVLVACRPYSIAHVNHMAGAYPR